MIADRDSSVAAVWYLAAALALMAGCSTTVSTTSGPISEARQPPAANEAADRSRRAQARLELASAYFGRGQMDVALSEVKLSLEADPTLGPAYNLRGLIYGNLGEVGLAEESFRRALAINARDADAMQNYGWFLCTQKRFVEGQAQFTTALATPQNRLSARIHRTLGVCQNMAGQWAEAENSLQRAIELEPTNPTTAFNLAEVLYRRGDFERARFYIRRVNSQQGVMNAQTLWLAARIEKRLGNQSGVRELGSQLVSRYRESREARSFERGQFDD
jgi:type IV pilus assembly protein PilF